MLISAYTKKLNNRTDVYRDRLLLVRQIINRIRSTTPSNFVVGIKLNAGDYLHGDVTNEEALEDCKQVALVGIDFIEISGGNYENPGIDFPLSRGRLVLIDL